jgi:bifunctional non-homologous end joining protein LigD
VKLDGWRVQVRRDAGGARFLSRTGADITDRFKGITRAASWLGAGTILDGELVAFGPDGRPDFDTVGARGASLAYVAFDVLFAGGEDIRPQPLSRRRQRLRQLLHGGSPEIAAADVYDDAEALLARVAELGLEGIVSKRREAPYRSGARSEWIKVKTKAWRAANADRWRRFVRA